MVLLNPLRACRTCHRSARSLPHGPSRPATIASTQSSILAPCVRIWNLYSIVCMEYPRNIPVIFQEMRYLRYIPGVELHDKSYLSIGFNACIACLGCALRYTQVCKEGRSSMLKIQSLNHFCGICLAYVTFGQVYHVHIWNSCLVPFNSQNNLEADSAHQVSVYTYNIRSTTPIR
jgi:hypothetical protein